MTLTRGRVPRDKQIFEVGELTREDLGALRQKRQLPVVTRLRDPHHLLARLLASGLRQAEAAYRAGYSVARVVQLEADPTFRELIQSYRAQVTEAFAEQTETFVALATGNMLKAERMIAEKLEAAEEGEAEVPLKTLLSISRDAADRLGHGKKTTSVNVNVDFAGKLERARTRSKTIDGTTGPARGDGAPLADSSPMPTAGLSVPSNGLRRLA